METVRDLYTRADFARLPEGFPAQLIAGAFVKEAVPVCGHQHLVARIFEGLAAVAGRGQVLPSPVGVPIDEYNGYEPDVALYRNPPPADERATVVPLAVFEILSPCTADYDRGIKRRKYLEAGVIEVWIVDREHRTIARHTRDGSATARGGERLESAVLPGFGVTPVGLFGPESE
jgi:Uma2 family endonuclease